MLKFMLVYRGGVVPDELADQNIKELWEWLDNLKETGYEIHRFAGSGRKIITQYSTDGYSGDIFGASIIEAKSLEEAVSLTSNWPELKYGGKIEIIEALDAVSTLPQSQLTQIS